MKADEIKALFVQFEQASQSLEAIELGVPQSTVNWRIHQLVERGINKDTTFVEVERDVVESVTEQLRDKFKYVQDSRIASSLYPNESVIMVRPKPSIRNVCFRYASRKEKRAVISDYIQTIK